MVDKTWAMGKKNGVPYFPIESWWFNILISLVYEIIPTELGRISFPKKNSTNQGLTWQYLNGCDSKLLLWKYKCGHADGNSNSRAGITNSWKSNDPTLHVVSIKMCWLHTHLWFTKVGDWRFFLGGGKIFITTGCSLSTCPRGCHATSGWPEI